MSQPQIQTPSLEELKWQKFRETVQQVIQENLKPITERLSTIEKYPVTSEVSPHDSIDNMLRCKDCYKDILQKLGKAKYKCSKCETPFLEKDQFDVCPNCGNEEIEPSEETEETEEKEVDE